jgi:beta-glucosidase
LGQFDEDSSVPFSSIPIDIVENKEHVSYALSMAQKSIVLLKNNKILPLKKTMKKITVIGPNADNAESLLGYIYIYIYFNLILILYLSYFNFLFIYVYYK